MSSSPPLAPQLEKLRSLLDGQNDVPIEAVYAGLIGRAPRSRRYAQQVLSKYIYRYHAANGPGRIEPGLIKGTLILKQG